MPLTKETKETNWSSLQKMPASANGWKTQKGNIWLKQHTLLQTKAQITVFIQQLLEKNQKK